MAEERQNNLVFWAAASIVPVLLLGWFVYISKNYPYYYIWDMDHIVSLDTMLIQSGLLPDHINHPSFGMNFLLFFTEKIGHVFDAVSVLDLDGLAESLNPLAVMAEWTDFIRIHSPFLALGIAALLCMALRLIFDIPRWYFVLFFVILGTQESLAYHSSMIRSELYSVFFWACGVLVMAMIVKAKGRIARWVAAFVMGLLIGLSFLTKIQSVFYLAALVVLLLASLFIFKDDKKQNGPAISRKNALWMLSISLFSVVCFSVLTIASYNTVIPPGVPTWAISFRIMPITVIFFLGLLSLFLYQLVLYARKMETSVLYRYCCLVVLIAAGFIWSFAFHFLIYSKASVSLNYMLLDFKMLFLRELKLSLIPKLSDFIPNFLMYASDNPVLFVMNIALISLLVLGWRFGFVRITKGQLGLCLLVSVIGFVGVSVGTRSILRDTLWREVLPTFLSLFFFAVLISRAVRYRRFVVGFGSGMLLIMCFANFVHCSNVVDRLDTAVQGYGWNVDRYFGGVYGGNQRKYSQIMQNSYDMTTISIAIAKTKAVDHGKIKRIVEYVFKNQRITHKNIGVAFDGFSVWSDDLDFRIAEPLPAIIRGAILVDSGSVEIEKRVFFKRVKSWEPYIFIKGLGDKQISVLTRSDLKIFLFVHSEDVSRLVSREIIQTPHKIILQNAGQRFEMQGLEVKNYIEIPLDTLSGKFFFVIRNM